ncbi:alpha/beta hydrolase family protein [Rugosimonospora africana]|uniref:Alpha/beta hydrolase n=1 Tax=Rugosimonospora africana TaxID=556532 RepID=A0A8J3QPA7_9ACTN|nr:alpha/beta fold hydrolase [Rugosimonospora africana]GIH13909.1 alpha/beta hydrolase [Rugosimonospora africana]
MRDELLHFPVNYGERIEIYSGVARLSGKIWARLVRPDGDRPGTAFLIVHPTSNFLGHYALEPLAGHGVAAVGMTTRYIGNDTSLLFENCVLDIASAVRSLRERGYERIVLVGNSGGGGLAALYQSQAEHPTITATPAGDPPDLTAAELPPVDGLIMLMAHPGRAQVYTEWLDPAIVDEHDPFTRDAALDMFDERNGPPYSAAFLARYRQAQLERSERIRAWVLERLARLAADEEGPQDFPFVVHGTCADPRFLDLSIDPSDRRVGTLWGDARTVNVAPATLGRYTSARAWLSQWSIRDSQGHGPSHLPHVSVPVLVVYGTADNAAFPGHARALYDAVAHDDRELVTLRGANHYFIGQPDQVTACVSEMVRWAREHGFN